MLRSRCRFTVLLATVIVFAHVASPALAMDKFDRIWLRDTLVGAGAGLGVGLLTSNNAFGWAVVGAIGGGVFGYFDAQKGLISYTPERGWRAGAPVVNLDVLQTPAGEKPLVKATLLQADW
jgi:hypothetical protein